MSDNKGNIIIYNTPDGKSSIALYAKDGSVWMNQNQIAELFATSGPNISMHISNILKERELDAEAVVKYYLTTAADGKNSEPRFKGLQDNHDLKISTKSRNQDHQNNQGSDL